MQSAVSWRSQPRGRVDFDKPGVSPFGPTFKRKANLNSVKLGLRGVEVSQLARAHIPGFFPVDGCAGRVYDLLWKWVAQGLNTETRIATFKWVAQTLNTETDCSHKSMLRSIKW